MQAAPGATITISGSNLDNGAVRFSGTNAILASNSSTQILALVPAGASSGFITVTTAGGTATSAVTFTVLPPAPTITGFSPASGAAGTLVAISGTTFTGATSVSFNGTLAASFTLPSATQINATVPMGATSGPIAITTPGGTATSAGAFIVTLPAPTITGFSPASGIVGSPVVITGTDLSLASSVTFNSVSASFAIDGPTQITATVPATTSGPIAITTPGGTATSPGSFIVTLPRPAILGFNPTSGLVGSSVVITGTGFSSASAVTFNNANASFTIDSSTQITATVPATTSGPIAVITPGGTATSANPFIVTPPAPTITGFNPTSGRVGSPVVITGTNFSSASSVAFNGVSASFAIDSPTQINAMVPATTSGPITVTTPGGTAVSANPFTLLVAAPTITWFSPTSGVVGSSVVIAGTNFSGTTAVTFNGVSASFTVNSPAQITATVPVTTTGPIAVTTPGGTAISSTSFNVNAPPPTITGFSPASGHVGSSVVITGTNFLLASEVTFTGVGASFATDSSTRITATVPSTTSGPIAVTTPSGTAVSAANFTVTPSGPTADLFIDGAYVTQSAQNFAGTVPLVAGKAGVLRVFALGNEAGITAPSVRVRRYSGATLMATETIAPALSTAPTVRSEGSLSQSWNYAISAGSTQPGLALLVDVDPANAITETDETNNTWPASGIPMAMDVRTPQTFHGTLIPVTQSGLTGHATSGNLASWYAKFQKMFPIAQGMDLLLGATYTTGQVLVSDGGGWGALLGELEAKRIVEASTRYYYGAVDVSYGSGVAGMAYVPSAGSAAPRTAIGWDKTSGYADGGLYYDVLTHETGHNMGRFHSPCGGVADPDPGYPYAGGLIGIYGLDVAAMTIKDPGVYTDIMGYCSPVWVSDYVYRSILEFRLASPYGLAEPDAPGAAVPAEADDLQDCLLVSGRVQDGHVELEPALRVRTIPTDQRGPASQGSRLIEGRDASGSLLFRCSLPLVQVADDLPGRQVRHFLAAIPMKGMAMTGLNELRVLGDLGPEAVRWSSQSLPLKSGAVQEPRAWSPGEGQVRLIWDAVSHPLVMVRDPGSGEVLSFARNGDMIIDTSVKLLELTLSSGVASETMLLAVQ